MWKPGMAAVRAVSGTSTAQPADWRHAPSQVACEEGWQRRKRRWMGAAAAFGLAAPIEHERRTSNAEHPTSNGRERWPGFGLRTGGGDAAITACGGLFLGLAIRWKEGETRSGRGRGGLVLW